MLPVFCNNRETEHLRVPAELLTSWEGAPVTSLSHHSLQNRFVISALYHWQIAGRGRQGVLEVGGVVALQLTLGWSCDKCELESL